MHASSLHHLLRHPSPSFISRCGNGLKHWLKLNHTTSGQTLFVDDIENTYFALYEHDRQLARHYMAQPELVHAYIQTLSKNPVQVLRYGFRQQLVKLGLPENCPVIDLKPLSATGKNAADMCMAIDLCHLPAQVNHVVIASLDTDMSKVAHMLINKGVKVDMLYVAKPAAALQSLPKVSNTPLLEALSAFSQRQEPISCDTLMPAVKKSMQLTLSRLFKYKKGVPLEKVEQILEQHFHARTFLWMGFENCRSLCMHVLGEGYFWQGQQLKKCAGNKPYQ